jgi:hypothetical protein
LDYFRCATISEAIMNSILSMALVLGVCGLAGAADDRVQVTRPIDSRAEMHGFEAPDGSLAIVAWQRTTVPDDGRRPAAGDEPPGPAAVLTLTVPGRRLRTAAAPPLEVTDRDDGTAIRLSVTQEHTLVFRLIPQ